MFDTDKGRPRAGGGCDFPGLHPPRRDDIESRSCGHPSFCLSHFTMLLKSAIAFLATFALGAAVPQDHELVGRASCLSPDGYKITCPSK